jgi:large subunit ribosomal protein L25
MSQDTISLSLDARQVTGKTVKHLRKQGIVPAVIHDHGKPSVNVQGDGIQMLKVWRQAGKHHPIAITTDGKKHTAMIKIAEFEPRKQGLNHIVFNVVSATEKVEAEVPIHVQYDEGNDSSPAERNGLLVLSTADSVLVEAIASQLPDALFYNGEMLIEVGDHATIADLIVPKGVVIKAELTQGIASVFEPSAVAAANDAAGGDAEAEDAETLASDSESAVSEGNQAADEKSGGQKQSEPKAE